MTIKKAFVEHLEVVTAALTQVVPAVEAAAALVVERLAGGNKVMILGNGGSAADAQHFAAELVGRFQRERAAIPAIALTTDTSLLTALGNDYGFERIFARQVEALARRGDVLICISTSGNSANVLAAARLAHTLGVSVIAFTGEGGGALADLADLRIVAPSRSTARIQEIHELALHALAEAIEAKLSGPS